MAFNCPSLWISNSRAMGCVQRAQFVPPVRPVRCAAPISRHTSRWATLSRQAQSDDQRVLSTLGARTAQFELLRKDMSSQFALQDEKMTRMFDKVTAQFELQDEKMTRMFDKVTAQFELQDEKMSRMFDKVIAQFELQDMKMSSKFALQSSKMSSQLTLLGLVLGVGILLRNYS